MTTRGWLGRSSVLAIVLSMVAVLLLAGTANAIEYRGKTTTTWVPDGTVYSMVRIEDTVYLGGDFTSFTNSLNGNMVTRNHLAAVDAATGKPTPWDPDADGVVRTLVKSAEGILYAGGDFVTVHGEAHQRLVAVDPAGDGTPVPTFLGSANAVVRDLQIVDTSLYVGGVFTRVGDPNDQKFRQHVAKLDLATGLVTDPTFKPRANRPVYSLKARGDLLYVGGRFTTLAGADRLLLGAVTQDTGEITDWAPGVACAKCAVMDMVATPGKLYAAMAGPGGRVFSYSRETGERLWRRKSNGDVQVIALRGRSLYVGGHFTIWAEIPDTVELVSVDPKTGVFKDTITRFTGRPYPGVWAILPGSSALLLGGAFHLADGVHERYAAFPAK